MARLGDLCRFINGDRGKNYPSQAEISSTGDVPFINAGHIVSGELDFSDMNYISEEKYEQLNSGKIQENDILYCLRGSLGKKVIIKGIPKGAIASSLVIIRPDSQLINSNYLFYALESPTVQEQMMQANNGSSQPNLSAKSVSDYTFNLPTINEQCEIVSKLAKVSELVALRKEQLAKLDQLVKSRFIELFGDPVINSKGWPVCELSEHIQFLTSGSRGWAQYFTESGEYFITIKNVKNCRITLDDVQHVIPPDNAEAKRTKVQEGDLLISITADLGRTGVVTKEIADYGGYINQHLTCIRLNKDAVRPLYVAYYMESEAGKSQFQAKNQSAVKAGLNFNSINSLKLMVPPIEHQDAFIAFVEQADKSKLAIQQSLDKLELLKKSLMQEYFG